jgi:hypothetical protein
MRTSSLTILACLLTCSPTFADEAVFPSLVVDESLPAVAPRLPSQGEIRYAALTSEADLNLFLRPYTLDSFTSDDAKSLRRLVKWDRDLIIAARQGLRGQEGFRIEVNSVTVRNTRVDVLIRDHQGKGGAAMHKGGSREHFQLIRIPREKVAQRPIEFTLDRLHEQPVVAGVVHAKDGAVEIVGSHTTYTLSRSHGLRRLLLQLPGRQVRLTGWVTPTGPGAASVEAVHLVSPERKQLTAVVLAGAKLGRYERVPEPMVYAPIPFVPSKPGSLLPFKLTRGTVQRALKPIQALGPAAKLLEAAEGREVTVDGYVFRDPREVYVIAVQARAKFGGALLRDQRGGLSGRIGSDRVAWVQGAATQELPSDRDGFLVKPLADPSDLVLIDRRQRTHKTLTACVFWAVVDVTTQTLRYAHLGRLNIGVPAEPFAEAAPSNEAEGGNLIDAIEGR